MSKQSNSDKMPASRAAASPSGSQSTNGKGGAGINPNPAKPFYISHSIEVNRGWVNNFATALPSYAEKFNIPQESVTNVQTLAAAFETSMSFLERIDAWKSEWMVCRNTQLDDTAGGITANFPQTPVFENRRQANRAMCLAP